MATDTAFPSDDAAYPQGSQAFGAKVAGGSGDQFATQFLGARLKQLKDQINNYPHPNSDYVRQREFEVDQRLKSLKKLSDE